jgi:hypothetical protein
MNKNTTIADVLTHLDQRIENLRGLKFGLEALVHAPAAPTDPNLPPTPPASAVNAATHARTGQSVATAAITILEAAQRPLHGLTEVVPALEAAGYRVSRNGLATTLLRTGRRRRRLARASGRRLPRRRPLSRDDARLAHAQPEQPCAEVGSIRTRRVGEGAFLILGDADPDAVLLPQTLGFAPLFRLLRGGGHGG